jgi:hypothetical protein
VILSSCRIIQAITRTAGDGGGLRRRLAGPKIGAWQEFGFDYDSILIPWEFLTMTFHFPKLRAAAILFCALTACAPVGVVSVATADDAALEKPADKKPGRRAGRRAGRRNRNNEAGFTRLFEGDSQEAWKGYGKEGWPEGWKLENGVLHRHAGGGDLMTKKEYGDFDLRFAWKVAEGGNSGVMYRASELKEPAYVTGAEYQILDNSKHADGKSPLTSAGSLYALYPPSEDATKPAGEWNQSRIVVKGKHVQHFLNGKKVVDTEIGSDDWNKKLAASKFATWPKYGKNDRGHVVLQDHGDQVWYRNMRIKELGENDEVK